MDRFNVGEEVMHDGRRFIVAGHHKGPLLLVRLLATRPTGVQVVWATPEALERIESYTTPSQDTNTF